MPSLSLNFRALPGLRFGPDAMAYARVATDGIDLVIENGLKPDDYNALVAVVRGAGGHFGDWNGSEDCSLGRVVAAATPSFMGRPFNCFAAQRQWARAQRNECDACFGGRLVSGQLARFSGSPDALLCR